MWTNVTYDVLGKIFTDRFGNKFIVEELAYRDKYHVAHYKIRFIESGFVTIATSAHIRGSKGRRPQDRLSPSVFGVGIMGYAYGKDSPKLFDVWRSMIARCYNQKNPSYKTYGGKGVTVCDRWKRFDYFLEDIKEVPGYDQDAINDGKLVLDKDLLSNGTPIYSKETCCFITRGENARESAQRRWNGNKV